jgi:hypothetical protein
MNSRRGAIIICFALAYESAVRQEMWEVTMKKIGLIVLIFVLLTVAAFLNYYLKAPKDDRSRLQKLASEFSILISEPKGNQQAVNLTGGRPAILVSRAWAEIEVKNSGWSYSGPMKFYVYLYTPRYEQREMLYELIAEMVGKSTEQARWVFEHPDLRVRLLGFAVVKECAGPSRPARRPALAGIDKAGLLKAVGALAADKDPFLAAGALGILDDHKFFRAEFLKNGLEHPCTEVRFECLMYAGHVLDVLDAGKLRETLGILIEHIDDRDAAVRAKCYSALGHAVFELDCRLQDIKPDRQTTFPREVVKLPELPLRWEDLAQESWTRASQVKQMWQGWYESLPEYADTSGQ